MTVTYGDQSFIYLLFRWKGSLWRSVWFQLLVFICIYLAINFSYRWALNREQQKEFEKVVIYCGKWTTTIPIQFLLGFYVTFVVGRWWSQLNTIPWPDKMITLVTANIRGNDIQSKLRRRTIARYLNLMSVLVWKEISKKVKKRFPTDEYLLHAGLMTEREYDIYRSTSSSHGRWFVPAMWIVEILQHCKDENRFGELAFQKMIEELYTFRGYQTMLLIYDWICVPLVYTQVATIVTYGYFATCIIGRQMIIVHPEQPVEGYEVDTYIPLFTVLEFLFYIGWLKVAEDLICPFGQDDEDFAMNYFIDRNVHISWMIADELPQQSIFPLEKDIFWKVKYPQLPHTNASYRAKVRDKTPRTRLYKYKLNDKDMIIVPTTRTKNNSIFEQLNETQGTSSRLLQEESKAFTRKFPLS